MMILHRIEPVKKQQQTNRKQSEHSLKGYKKHDLGK